MTESTPPRVSWRGIATRLCVVLLLISTTLCAIWILTGQLDETKARVLISTLSGTFYLGLFLASAEGWEHYRNVLNGLGQLFASAGLALTLFAIWSDGQLTPDFWRAWSSTTLLALCGAHSALLSLADRTPLCERLGQLTAGITWGLGLLSVYMIFNGAVESPLFWRGFIVAALIDVMVTLAIAVLHRLAPAD